MDTLKVIGVVLGVLIVALLGVGLMLPASYDVERSRVIKSKRECLYDNVVDLEKNVVWAPWKMRDPTMEITFGEITRGEGATYTWTSSKSGGGSFEVVSVVPNERVETAIDFGNVGRSKGYWTFERQGVNTRVTWGLEGEAAGIVDRYFILFMDSMAGADFEEGLDRLAQVCER